MHYKYIHFNGNNAYVCIQYYSIYYTIANYDTNNCEVFNLMTLNNFTTIAIISCSRLMLNIDTQ